MQQLEVQIMGQSYRLSCPEADRPHLLRAVEKVDAAMCKIRDTGKIKARERIAILAALNLAFEAPPGLSPVSSQDSVDMSSSQQQLIGLLHRLDSALEADGQLL